MIQLFRGARGGEYSAPKTVLGFFNIVLAILTTGCVGVAAVLASQPKLYYLIPYSLGLAFVFFVILVVGVFIVMLKDPTKLQLGEVSARDFINYQLTLGDSAAGEHQEPFFDIRADRRTLKLPAPLDDPSSHHTGPEAGDKST